MIDKIFSVIAMPFNYILDFLPYPWMIPFAILGMSYVLATLTSGYIQKFKLFRIIFLTYTFYLAFTAVGVQ